MEGLYSKTGGSGTPSPLLQASTSSQLTADFSSYEEACNQDPELKSFDVTLHGRINHVIKILADGVELRSLGSFKEVKNSVEIRSLGSFKEVTNCLLEMNQDVVKVILESKEDIWDNPELFDLVEEYFKSSVKTMEFCTALGSCLERAQNSQLIIQLAINQFEQEVEMEDGAVEMKFVKTLEGLQKFKAAGDPFTPQFYALFQSVHEQQVSMLKKSQSQKKTLDKKLKSMKRWRRVSNVGSAAAVAAPPVVTALAGAMAVPIAPVGNWCNTLLNRYEKALEEEKAEEDLAVKLVINAIKRKMAVFMESIEDLADHAGKCHADIIAARRVILNRILKDAHNQ
ncbi:UPF0496 PROTEIN 3-RELATED [Salix viminalis]|uniref:UPF0496 PROTEIN 3-RELATED n=1 Tax=Salix viminalis TaxID=40686 RepID=A0A9Q0NZC7_SALVM|nr:UPF0496 PROTEIN 3-RELATED [Salix viminalis]